MEPVNNGQPVICEYGSYVQVIAIHNSLGVMKCQITKNVKLCYEICMVWIATSISLYSRDCYVGSTVENRKAHGTYQTLVKFPLPFSYNLTT